MREGYKGVGGGREGDREREKRGGGGEGGKIDRYRQIYR